LSDLACVVIALARRETTKSMVYAPLNLRNGSTSPFPVACGKEGAKGGVKPGPLNSKVWMP
jgi:hypothetical protein